MRRLIGIGGVLGCCAAALWGCGSSSSTSSTPTAPTSTVSSIAVSGTAPAIGATAQFAATATMSGGTTQDVTSQSTWSSSNTAVATVSSSGVVTGVAVGETDVTATYQGVSGSTHISVAAPASSSCTFTLSLTTVSVPSTGGAVSVDVTASQPTCTWTATSGSAFITVTSGAGATGNGTVGFTVGANTGPARSGRLTVAGQTVTVTQDAVPTTPTCSTTTISPTSQNFGEAATTATVTVTAGNCSWTAVSNASFISIVSGGSGVGNGTVTFSITANTTGNRRSGAITIGGDTFTATQDPCGYTLSRTSFFWERSGGSGSLTVTAIAACSWTATSNASFITVTSGATGSGSGTVTFTVAANSTGSSRTGTLTIAGQTVTVEQSWEFSCFPFTVFPTTFSVGASGASRLSIDAVSADGCGLLVTATSNSSFITIEDIGFHIRGATVYFTVAGNPGASRTGTMTVAGRTVTVTQSGQ